MSEAGVLPKENAAALADTGDQPKWKKWALLGLLSLGLAIIIIDTTLLNVSLATIIKDLHTDLQSIQWVITAYALVLAAFTITGGRLGDLFGRKRMFMLGAVIFAVGSFLASVSHSLPTLLLGESIIEGFGAALMMPATASLVVANFKGKERANAFGIWGAVAGASSAIGPLLGGYLTSHFSWRWGFRINVFVGALVVLGAMWLIRESRESRKPGLDWGGVLFSSTGLLALVFGIIESSTYGWWKAKSAVEYAGHQLPLGGLSITPVAIAIGVLLLLGFFWWERRRERVGKTPLVYLDLFKNGRFTSGSLVILILTLGMTGLVFALPVFLQAVKNLDAFHTGLSMLPMSIALFIGAPLAGALSKKIRPRTLIMTGLFLDVIALFIMRWTLNPNLNVWHLVPGLMLFGFGMGMVQAPISNLTLSAVGVEQAGEASGVNNTLRQVGSTLGTAVIGAAVLTSLVSTLALGIQQSPVLPPEVKAPIVHAISSPTSNIEFGVANFPPNTPPYITEEINGLAKQASTHASQNAFVYAALFTALALVAAMFLPGHDSHAAEEGMLEDVEDMAHPRRKWAVAGLLAVLIIAGGIVLLRQGNKTAIATGAQAPVLPPGSFTNGSLPSQATSTETANSEVAAASSTPAVATTSPNAATSTMLTYEHFSLNYSLSLSPGWSEREQSASQHDYKNSRGQIVSIEVYDYANQDLKGIGEQLAGSPSVVKVEQATFKGVPALVFLTDSHKTGFTFIYKNKLYYIMADSAELEPIKNLSLL